MPFLTALSLLAGLPGLAGSVLAVPADLLLRGVADFLKLLAEIPLSLYFGGLPLALLAGGSVLLMLQLWGRARQYLAWILVLCVAISGLWILTDRLCCTIWFLDVGQADAILIRNRGNWILVDCGDAYAGEGAVVPALTFLGVRRLDALIITHSHDDHAGGLQAVLARFPVENVLVNGSFINSPWAELVPQARVVRGHYSLADNLHIYAHNLPLSEENDCSLLISLTAPGGSVLLTGDLQAEGERMYFGELSPHAVLKVAHHGSSSSTSEDFLRRVRPRTAVISCGLGNRYALPHGETLDRLRDSGAEILRTDVHGCVRMRFWPWPSYTVTTFTGR
jgi:competence protein ComEC